MQILLKKLINVSGFFFQLYLGANFISSNATVPPPNFAGTGGLQLPILQKHFYKIHFYLLKVATHN